MTSLIDTTEMYLKTVYELLEEQIIPMRARIADRLGHSGPTVSQTVARMERDGLLVVTGDRHLKLTPTGLRRAMRVMRKHRLAERLLTDVIGLDWSLVHTEACRWEHVISEPVERRLLALLDRPQCDPYGNPIPGLVELGVGGGVSGEGRILPLTEAVPAEPAVRGSPRVDARLARLGETVQVDIELLRRFASSGILPQRPVAVTSIEDGYALSGVNSDFVLEIPQDLARHVYVGVR